MPAQWPSQPMSTLKAMPSLLLDLHTFFGLYPWIYIWINLRAGLYRCSRPGTAASAELRLLQAVTPASAIDWATGKFVHHHHLPATVYSAKQVVNSQGKGTCELRVLSLKDSGAGAQCQTEAH